MAPSHGGDTLGSILGQWGPIGANKNGYKPSKITMPQNSDFDYFVVIELGKKSN